MGKSVGTRVECEVCAVWLGRGGVIWLSTVFSTLVISTVEVPGFVIRIVVSIAWGLAVQRVGCIGELPHAT